MDVRPIRPDDVNEAARVLAAGYGTDDEGRARELLRREVERDAHGTLVAAAGGALAGVGCVRVRGEIATVGPLAVAAPGRGTGGALLDALLERAEAEGAAAVRASVDGGNVSGFALLASRGFTAVDTAVELVRAAGPPPAVDGWRGLELGAPVAADFEEVLRMDERLTGHARSGDLATSLTLVARRRGALVGWLAAAGRALGPAVAVDSSDLFILIARAVTDLGPAAEVRARLSTAMPAAAMAAVALGFRVAGVGVVMSRGAPPPTRPPQLYSLEPEVV